MSEPCIEDYAIGWICALQEEYEAACRMLDDEFEGLEMSDVNDNNTYVFGRISGHNVVIGCLPDGRYGISSAAVVARDMVRSFPSLKFALMVGIGGGAPTAEKDIRLGDVVVSVPQGKLGGVIQYDFGKRLSDSQFQLTGQMNSPPEVLLGAIPEMRRRHNDSNKPDRISEHLRLMDDMPDYQRPDEDQLYRADYEHKGGVTCSHCEASGLEKRSPRVTKRAVTVHYGIIASANSVMKNAKQRDQYAQDPELQVLCFEMEAGGLMNNFPSLVIRGICDYSDSHKNDEWHKYAALASAAYARELLHVLKPRKVAVLPSWAGKLGRLLEDIQNIKDQTSATSRKADTIIDYYHTQKQKEILHWLTEVDYGPQQSDYFGRRQRGTAEGRTTFSDSVKLLYHKHKDKRSRPSFEDISSTLQSVVALYSRVFILIDALDECRASDGSRTRFLAEVFKLQARSGANIFATSRFIPDITEVFQNSISLEISATEEDVRRYLQNHMLRLPAFVRRSPELQEEVKSSIVHSVQGMFLLAQFHLESLINKISIKAVRNALAKLPSGSDAYDHAYETAMERIEQQAPGHRDFAKQILSWITCAKRPLTTLELRHALAVEVGTTELDEEALPEIEDIVVACVGLVTNDKQSDIIRLVHYTTQQYFDKNRGKWFPNAEAGITTTCATYLLFNIFESGFCRTDEEFEERLRLNPFYEYSAHHWGNHARKAPTLCQEVIDFLESDTKVESSSQALMAARGYLGRGYSQIVPMRMTGLHLVAYFGIQDSVQTLSRGDPVNLRDSHGMTALSYAAERGHEVIVKLLLEMGKVDVNIQDTFGITPLSRATRNGHEAIVKLLLEMGKVDVDIQDKDGTTPLSWAARNGYEGIDGLRNTEDIVSPL
ncbi:hypothetical protein QL093DRAFT_2594685 [Fusarium oxysporum]|nr:hypothetical protein FOWG_17078 [Fusarium oxysporum f. sp. lycopersici MN25]KAJ9413674.1 hypothetical protein QL093DRAFT_2594685 [Fusarium oxysporum]